MPNAKQHLIAGLAVGAVVNSAIQWLDRVDDPTESFDWGELLVCSFAAGVKHCTWHNMHNMPPGILAGKREPSVHISTAIQRPDCLGRNANAS